MKLLLDTNILIDYYARRRPFFQEVVKLRVAAMFGDVELWAAIQSFSDVECALRKAIPVERLRDMMRRSMNFLKVAAPTAADLSDALGSGWPDLEDRLVARCAERVKADRIITRDLDGFASSPIKAQTPLEYLAWLEEEQGIVYDELDLSGGI